MFTARTLLATILLGRTAAAQAQDTTRETNPFKDAARAQGCQADELHQLRQIESDRALHEDRDRRNAARDARSSRRFDPALTTSAPNGD